MYLPIIRLVWRMPWLFHYLSWFVPLAVSMVSVVDSGREGRTLPPVYWNTSNSLFRSDNYAVHINMFDDFEIRCPDYNGTGVPPSDWEYYVIYIVNKTDYDACDIPVVNPKNLIVNCSAPLSGRYFTITVSPFNPLPGTRDFKSGQSYYFITTSTGTLGGLNNQLYGACRDKNMKIKMEVCCSSTTQTSSPGSNITGTTRRPSINTSRPETVTTRRQTTTTTRQKTTTPTTTTTTKHTTKLQTPPVIPTTNLPGGKPHDPTDIIIDAPGTLNNVGVINSSVTLRPSLFVLILTVFLLTFALFSR